MCLERNSRLVQLLVGTLLIFGLPSSTDSSNILAIFPNNVYSHFRVFYPMLEALAERGHNITVITHFKAPFAHPNYEELLLSGNDVVDQVITFDTIFAKRNPVILLDEYYVLYGAGQSSCELFYESGHVQTVLERHKRQPYELIITEYFNTDCQLGLAHVMDVPVVGLSSCPLMPYFYDRIGLPDIPSYVQGLYIGFPQQLNWHQRLSNFLQFRVLKLLYRYHTLPADRRLIKQHLKVDVNLDDLVRNKTALILVNQHYSLSGNYPLPAQLVQMGGIHIEEKAIKAELPEKVAKFLDTVPLEQGVVFISWGSMVRAASMPPEKMKNMVQVLKRLPYKIIWKWESDEVPIKSDKFLFVKWAPQLSLLCHPKVKIFWSHGGLLGTFESVYCGKPMIITPIFGDHFQNGHAAANRHVAVLQYFHDIDETHLSSTFKQIMDKSFAQNAQSLSHIFRNRERSPLNTTVWWIEHLLQEHANTAQQLLHSPAVELNWFVYHSFDSLLLCLLGIVIWAAIVGVVVKLFCLLRKSRKTKTD